MKRRRGARLSKTKRKAETIGIMKVSRFKFQVWRSEFRHALRDSVAVSCFLLFASCAFAQQFSVGWAKIAAGSSTSSNGQYTVSGTFGQHNAGPMSGGSYALTGNFWAIFAVQTPGAPVLTVTLSGPNTVVVSWSLSAANFVLEQNSNLTTATWTTSGYPITTNGGIESITITSPPPGNLFFRLKD